MTSGPAPEGAESPKQPERAEKPWPERGRILALDPGQVRIGAAICDAERKIASPLEIWTRKGNEPDSRWLLSLVKREEARALVIGLPIRSQGEEGESARRARGFAAWAARVSGLPFRMVDESFTTRFAESALWEMGLTHQKRRARRDSVAAQMLLQGYIDAGCPDELPPV